MRPIEAHSELPSGDRQAQLEGEEHDCHGDEEGTTLRAAAWALMPNAAVRSPIRERGAEQEGRPSGITSTDDRCGCRA